MTFKQDKLIQAIPTSKTMREAGIKAGYSPISRQLYKKATKLYITQYLEEQGITKESLTKAYQRLLNLCQEKDDLSTAKGTIDSLAKMHNYMKDNNIVQSSIWIDAKAEDDARRVCNNVNIDKAST